MVDLLVGTILHHDTKVNKQTNTSLKAAKKALPPHQNLGSWVGCCARHLPQSMDSCNGTRTMMTRLLLPALIDIWQEAPNAGQHPVMDNSPSANTSHGQSPQQKT